MRYNEFEYAGLNSREDLELYVGQVPKPIAPTMSAETQNIPGKYGELFLGTNYGARVFEIPVAFIANNVDDYERILANLTNALVDPDETDGEYPLVFGSQPNVEYYGHWTQLPAPSYISQGVYDGQATLEFTCSDPRGYLPQQTVPVTQARQTLNVLGNAESAPIISVTAKQDLYHIGYIDTLSGDYTAIGWNIDKDVYNADTGLTLHDREPVAQDDPCADLSQWVTDPSVTGSVNIENGERDGKLAASTHDSLQVPHATKDFHTGQDLIDKNGKKKVSVDTGKTKRQYGNPKKHKNWYGPLAVHTNVPNPTNDWRVRVRFHHEKNYFRSMGKIELYLLDDNGERRGKIMIKDLSHGRMPVMSIQLGTHGHHHEMLTDKSGGLYHGPLKYAHQGTKSKTVTLTTYTYKKVKTKVKTKTKRRQKRSLLEQHVTGDVLVMDATTGHLVIATRAKRRTKRKRKYTVHKSKGRTSATQRKTNHRRKTKSGKTKKSGRTKPKWKWKNKSIAKKHTVSGYVNRTDVFSHFYGDITLQKIGNVFKCKVTLLDQNTGQPKATFGQRTFVDENNEYGFALNTSAIYLAKYNITEDKLGKYYPDPYLTITNYKVWNIIDGGNGNTEEPTVIAHAGETVQINAETKHVYKDQQFFDTNVSFGSSFPELKGGKLQVLAFDPAPGSEADIELTYRPTTK